MLGKDMSSATAGNDLDRHPFVVRLLKYVELTPADLKSLDAIIDGEL